MLNSCFWLKGNAAKAIFYFFLNICWFNNKCLLSCKPVGMKGGVDMYLSIQTSFTPGFCKVSNISTSQNTTVSLCYEQFWFFLSMKQKMLEIKLSKGPWDQFLLLQWVHLFFMNTNFSSIATHWEVLLLLWKVVRCMSETLFLYLKTIFNCSIHYSV